MTKILYSPRGKEDHGRCAEGLPLARDKLRPPVDGLSDMEIAAALGIARFTASNHVTATGTSWAHLPAPRR